MRRQRNAKIVATLGPSSSTAAEIESLFRAGADVFRLNFSHGALAEHQERVDHIRALEAKYHRPTGILMDLQGPKLRVGPFKDGKAVLQQGASFRLDLNSAIGDATRVNLPHPEIFAALKPGGEIVLVNHIGAESGPRKIFEQCFAPLARKLGWRPEFPWKRLADWAERDGVHLIERRPMPPMGHFSLIRFGKGASAAA